MIVFLDDEQNIVEIYTDETKRLLKCANVFGFTDPIECIDFVKKNLTKTTLFSTDYSMSPIKGVEIIKAFRILGLRCKCVIITGMEDVLESAQLISFESSLNIELKTWFKQTPVDIRATLKELCCDKCDHPCDKKL